MNKNALAIFVKTPDLSPVKTRLARGIGESGALIFYELSRKAVAQVVRGVEAQAYWAVAEADGVTHPDWQNGFGIMHTGSGGLGQRQHTVYSALLKKYGRAMLIGADCPQITPALLSRAFDALAYHDFAIGPATDGGYYLFAGRRDVPLSIWEGVTYSAAGTRQELCEALPAMPYELPVLTDVDEREDLEVMCAQMPDNPSQAQRDLIRHCMSRRLIRKTGRSADG